MVLPEDSNNPIVDALREITESLDRSTATLNRIADHYDKIVPVMKKNQEHILDDGSCFRHRARAGNSRGSFGIKSPEN